MTCVQATRIFCPRACCYTVCLVFLWNSVAAAATYNWVGGTGTWNTSSANWSGSGTTWPTSGSDNDAVFGGSAGTVTIAAGGVTANDLTFSTAGYTIQGAPLTINGTSARFTTPTSGTTTISANIVGSGVNFDKLNFGGTLILTGNNTFNEGVIIRGGTLSVATIADSGSSNIGIAGGGNSRISIGGGATLQYTGTAAASTSRAMWHDFQSGTATIDITQASGSLTWTPSGGARSYPLRKAGAGTFIFNGNIDSSATVTVDGGMLELGANNIYTGATNVNVGTLRIGHANALGGTGGGTTVASGAVLDINGFAVGNESLSLSGTGISSTGALINSNTSAAGSYAGNISLGTADVYIGGAGDLTLTGNISGAAANYGISKIGSGKLTLTGNNTYNQGTIVRAGTLSVSNISDTGSSNIGITGGTNSRLSFSATSTFEYTGTGSQSTSRALWADIGGNTVTFDITSSTGQLTFNPVAGTRTNSLVKKGAGTLVLNGVMGGAAATFTVDGGTLVLGANNSYGGLTTINSGTLKLGTSGSGGNTPLGTTAGETTVFAGGALDLNGFSLSSSEALTLRGTGVSSSGALLNSAATAATWSGLVTLAADASIVASGGNINLSNAGTITGSGFALTLGGDQNITIGSIIGTGNGELIKQGAGVATLNRANTYSGYTTIAAGTLALGASGGIANSPLIHVASGATFDVSVVSGGFTLGPAQSLSGSGTVEGTITVLGAIQPGNSPGTITTGAEIWGGGGSYEWEINNALGTMGNNPGWDWINGLGTLTITATEANPFTIEIVGLDPLDAVGAVAGWDAESDHSWVIATFTDIVGFDADKFVLDSSSFVGANSLTTPFGPGSFNLRQDGDNLVLDYVAAVPEPTSILVMLLAGTAGLLFWLRRR